MKSLFESITTEDKVLLENINQLNEGWAIFESIGTTSQWQIERLDNEEKFMDDSQAIKHVYEMALMGSVIHNKALEFIRKYGSAAENLYVTQSITK